MSQTITLYHGTDARMVSMKKDERNDFLSMVDRIISKLWEIYEPYYSEFDQEKFSLPNGDKAYKYKRRIELLKDRFMNCGKEVVFYNLFEKLSMLDSRYNMSGLFQYGCLYLASTKETATNYARRSFAGGELGLIAYRLIEGMDILCLPEWNPDSETQKDLARFLDFCEEEKADPVIITIEGIDSDYLLSEDGGNATWFFDFLNHFGYPPDYKFRYKGELCLSGFPIEHLKKA